MQTRERIHRLIDDVPDGELDEIERLLVAHRASARLLAAFADAPEDDEPVTPEDEAALAEAYADVAAGRVLIQDAARRRLLGHP